MIERAVCRLTISRSARSIGLPVRQTMRVVPGVGDALADLVLHLHLVLVGQDDDAGAGAGSRWPATSSVTIAKTCGDQPRITVWSLSTTCERPLRSSSSLPSMPLVSTPISVLTTKMPPRVTASIESRNGQLPVSPPMVPASSVRMSDIQATSTKPTGRPSAGGAHRAAHTGNAMTTMSAAEATASQPMSAGVPRERVLSKA